MEVLKLKKDEVIPENFTGIAEYKSGNKYWYREGNLHREDGPAFEWASGYSEWYLDNIEYSYYFLFKLINELIFLGTEKGKYGLVWLRFFTEEGIKEFPIIPGMEKEKRYISLFKVIEDLEEIRL